MKKIHIFISIVVCVIVAFSGCKSPKKVLSPISKIEDKANSELFADILQSQFDYQTLSAKLNVGLSSGSRTLQSRATLRMIKDEAVQVSVQPLFGVELFRLYVDKDSVLLLDRMNKRYVHESMSALKERYPIGFDFYTLQALLTNHIFVAGKNPITPTDVNAFTFSPEAEVFHKLTATDAASGVIYSFSVDGQDNVVFTHLMKPQRNYSLGWEYKTFTEVNDQFFPHEMTIQAQTAKRKMNVAMTLSGILLNETFTLSNKVPSGYSKVSADTIVNMLSKLK